MHGWQGLANDWGLSPLQKYVIARAAGTILHRVQGREEGSKFQDGLSPGFSASDPGKGKAWKDPLSSKV